MQDKSIDLFRKLFHFVEMGSKESSFAVSPAYHIDLVPVRWGMMEDLVAFGDDAFDSWIIVYALGSAVCTEACTQFNVIVDVTSFETGSV